MIGELIGHNRVQELVGRGAMGVVYKALDVNIDRPVAIKVMSVEARNDPAFVERFRQEARLQGALNHPNIALLFDYFIHNDAPIAVMEFIDGESLDQLIRRRGAIPAHESIPIFKQALLGVSAAHRAGIIHRNLKAANLMITKDGIVKVMDFGVAKRPGTVDATKASTSVGSPLCMAPEQILGRTVDVRTDVYALGVTLYQLLTGQPPFNPRGKSEYSVLNSHVNDLPDPPTVHRRDIPKPIVNAVMRAIAKEPDARFQSAEEFMRALPDVAAPSMPALPSGATDAVATPQVGPTGTMVIPRAGPTGTIVIARSDANGTVAKRQVSPTATISSPPSAPTGAMASPTDAPSTRREPSSTTVIFDYSPPTAPHVSSPPSGGQGPRVARTGFSSMRVRRPLIAATLVATLLLGILFRHRDQLVTMLMGPSPAYSDAVFEPVQGLAATRVAPSSHHQAPPPTQVSTQPQATAQTPASAQGAVPPPAPAPSPVATTDVSTPATTAPAARHDLSGVWHGEYIDASGKQLLRIVSLRIRHMRNDGGIDGVLRYQAASGTGECQLLPNGSTYSAGEQRLQLSPEGCSPHYPKELGVPLDFSGVKPQATLLKDGRIEAPTGEAIRVRLKRAS